MEPSHEETNSPASPTTTTTIPSATNAPLYSSTQVGQPTMTEDDNLPLEPPIRFRTRKSQPSWAASHEPRAITREELEHFKEAFDIIMGIPKETRTPISLWDRLFHLTTDKYYTTDNTSYVQNGVLYLIPEDFAYFMDIRRFKKDTDTNAT